MIQVRKRLLVSQLPSSPNHPLSTFTLSLSTLTPPFHLPHSFHPHPHPHPQLTKSRHRPPHSNQVHHIICRCAKPPRYSLILPVNTTTDVRENIRSLVQSIIEGTRQTDRVISGIRNLLAETDTTDDTTFETCNDEENMPPAPLTPISAQGLGKHLRPLSTTTLFQTPSYPSPSPSPSTRIDQLLRTPVIRRKRDTPLPSIIGRVGEMAKGSPNFNC